MARPFLKISPGLRKDIKIQVVPPVESRPLLDAEAAAVALVRDRIVGELLLLLDGHQPEEVPRHHPHPLHQIRAHPVVHHLEEPPLRACLGNRLDDGVRGRSQVDYGDAGWFLVRLGRRALGRELDVAVGDSGDAAAG